MHLHYSTVGFDQKRAAVAARTAPPGAAAESATTEADVRATDRSEARRAHITKKVIALLHRWSEGGDARDLRRALLDVLQYLEADEGYESV
jgi:hypothetical protein